MADIPAMFDCIIGYASEGWQTAQRPVCHRQTRESLYNVVTAQNFCNAVVEIDGVITGVALGYFGHTWWDIPDASIDLFYVRKEARGTLTARSLVAEMIAQFKSHDVGFLYAGAESGIGDTNTRLYENLYKKFGFIDCGGGRMILNLQPTG